MSKYRIIGNEDGWSEPIYADEYGNIVSKEEVERERLKDEIKRELQKEKQPEIPEALKMAMARKAVLEWEYEKQKRGE